MFSKLSKLIVVASTIVYALSASVVSTFAQGLSICGRVESGAWDVTLTVWGTNEVFILRPINIANLNQLNSIAMPGYVRVYEPRFINSSSGVVDSFSRIEKVSGCESASPTLTKIKPGFEAISPHKDCMGEMHITVSDLPKSWQSSVLTAANTWNNAGSKFKINTTATLSDNQRTITPLDYDDSSINLPAGSTLSLAKCEIRVMTAWSLPERLLASVAKRSKDMTISTLVGWVQSYPDPNNSKVALAQLLVLNNIDFNWSTSDSALLLQGIDVETIALHELGHAIGVPHISKGAVMSGDFLDHVPQWLGVTIRDLTQADIDALINLYGNDVSISGNGTPPTQSSSSDASISFAADNTDIQVGSCTILRWDINGVQALYLDREPIGGQGSKKVCPSQSTTYEIAILLKNGEWEPRQVRINVTSGTLSNNNPSEPNHAPNAPSPTSPNDWSVFTSTIPQLCARSNGDPDGDTITFYRFEILNRAIYDAAYYWNSGWVSTSCVTPSSLVYYGSSQWDWHVKVRDSHSVDSDWSSTWHFDITVP